MARRRTPTDEVMTEVFSEAGHFPGRTSEVATKVSKRPAAPPPVIEDPTDVDKVEPIRVISMKTAGTARQDGVGPARTRAELETNQQAEAARAERVLPRPQIRSISEVHRVPAADLGNLARPRIQQARRKRLMTNLGRGITVIAIALVVAIALWFLMQRR